MTLVEILIAMGILAFGLFGILTLFPIAIRNISTATGRTSAATVAKSVMTSLQSGYLDLRSHKLSSTDNRTEVTADPVLDEPSGAALYWIYTSGFGTSTDPRFSRVIQYFAAQGGTVGDGSTDSTFRIPDNLANKTDVGDGNLVKPDWAPGYGWTATFLPLSDDIDEHTCYRVQIAVWREYQLKWQGDAEFTPGDDTVQVASRTDAKPGDYIRLDKLGIWYRIQGVNDDNKTVELAVPFKHPSGGVLSGPASIASRFKLVGIYETVVGPTS